MADEPNEDDFQWEVEDDTPVSEDSRPDIEVEADTP